MRLALLLLVSCAALSGCGSAHEEVEPAEGSPAAEERAAAGPLSGLVSRLQAEDDAREQAQGEEREAPSAQEREEQREEAQQEEAQRMQDEEGAIEEEAHLRAGREEAS